MLTHIRDYWAEGVPGHKVLPLPRPGKSIGLVEGSLDRILQTACFRQIAHRLGALCLLLEMAGLGQSPKKLVVRLGRGFGRCADRCPFNRYGRRE